MQACGRLIARMGEQDVDRDIAAGIEIDGARPSCRAAARPAKLPPMMMTSFMVMGSVLWMG